MQAKAASSVKPNPWGDDHPEKIRENPAQGGSFASQLKNQVADFASPDAWFGQLFGKTNSKERRTPPPTHEKPIRRTETLIFCRAERLEEQNLTRETHAIMEKLKEQVVLLEKSEKNLVNEVSKIKVEQLPKKSGIYYIRFLEWLLTVVKQLRVKVEEGRAWLATFNQRKKKRIGYWQMYKKHGTTFGLSHERTLATQTG